MTAGDFVALLASKVVFPVASVFSPRDPDVANSGLRIYTSPFGQKILYRPGTLDKMVLWEQWGAKDYQTVTVKEGDVVIEIGGHIGTSTLNYSHLVGPRGVVYSIEALPENFDILKRNIERNGITNVKAFHLAIVGDSSIDHIVLNKNPYNSGGHSIFKMSVEEEATSVCPAMTLDAFIKTENIDRVDILQMDIEGAEFDILLSADKALLASIPQIMFEYHDAYAEPRTHAELLDLLNGIGFTTHEYINFIAKTLKLETGIITAYKSPKP
ncbi:MAG TPA: FkbM family methyltransferase [Rhodanobacteraceae bacterium]|nr:FkbM family methyltransferase [Rhodanobacteraceae bacterium]